MFPNRTYQVSPQMTESYVINERGEPVFSGIGGNSQKEYDRIVAKQKKEKTTKIANYLRELATKIEKTEHLSVKSLTIENCMEDKQNDLFVEKVPNGYHTITLKYWEPLPITWN